MQSKFLEGFPGRRGRERIILAVGVVAPCFGMLAGWLIDRHNRWDTDGGVIQSPSARGILFSSFVVTMICGGLYFWFRHKSKHRDDRSDTKARNIIIIILLIIVTLQSGYIVKQRQDLREVLTARLLENLSNYDELKKGRVEHAQEICREMILYDVDLYARWFGAPSGTNHFANLYSIAKKTPQQVVSGAFKDLESTIETNAPE
jgi:hypothetical protein